jgi:predicted acylesterase/phospholipase RssA
MERLRIPVDAIAGISLGSIIGALYASGMSPTRWRRPSRRSTGSTP